MEKIIEVTAEIEKKGVEILKKAQEKSKEILELAENRIANLRSHEMQRINDEITKLNKGFQTDINEKIKKLSVEKEKKITSISNVDLTKIDLENLIEKDILEL